MPFHVACGRAHRAARRNGVLRAMKFNARAQNRETLALALPDGQSRLCFVGLGHRRLRGQVAKRRRRPSTWVFRPRLPYA
jgi:hypothetical protein